MALNCDKLLKTVTLNSRPIFLPKCKSKNLDKTGVSRFGISAKNWEGKNLSHFLLSPGGWKIVFDFYAKLGRIHLVRPRKALKKSVFKWQLKTIFVNIMCFWIGKLQRGFYNHLFFNITKHFWSKFIAILMLSRLDHKSTPTKCCLVHLVKNETTTHLRVVQFWFKALVSWNA